MNIKKIILLALFAFFYILNISGEIRFKPIALTKQNKFLFNSIEIIAGKEYNKTLFTGSFTNGKVEYNAVSFYPENLYYSKDDKKLYIQNRMGLYYYDQANDKIETIKIYPEFTNNDEYIIFNISKASFSPSYRYILGKVATSNTKASIYLYDLQDNTKDEVVKDVEIQPGQNVALWSNDSNYFVYQKNGKIYYFSINDYKQNKLLTEEWRFIGNARLNNAMWTADNQLLWIEGSLIYKADSRQFYTRSIYRKYLRQGNIAGKIPFEFDQSFDLFRINYNSNSFILSKNYSSFFYYSLSKEFRQNPYLQLNEKSRFSDCFIFNSGETILLIDELEKGEIKKKIILLKKQNNDFAFKNFDSALIQNRKIINVNINNDTNQFVVCTDNGAFCFNIDNLSAAWQYTGEKILQALYLDNDEWALGGVYTTIKYYPKANIFKPVFASSFTDAGFFENQPCIIINGKNYSINEQAKTIAVNSSENFKLYKEEKTEYHRLISRELNKGFYAEAMNLKDLYSGKFITITGEPHLNYKLYQPENKLGYKYYYNPNPEKYEVALVFNCIKSAEGLFQVLTKLNQLNIQATFFINGNFIDINPEITKEIASFNFEIGNLFQYYADLTNTEFLIDKNFISQGLSANEEKFYKLTGKNFNPVWHTPMYLFTDSIIKYGEQNGYKFVSFNLDSLDWVSEKSNDAGSTMNNSGLIERILKSAKPGQIIIFSTGKNDSERTEWLFNDLDLLISELVRSGYSFTTASDILKKYRE